MKIALQYFDGCPYRKSADRRLANVPQGPGTDGITFEYQLIDSLRAAM